MMELKWIYQFVRRAGWRGEVVKPRSREVCPSAARRRRGRPDSKYSALGSQCSLRCCIASRYGRWPGAGVSRPGPHPLALLPLAAWRGCQPSWPAPSRPPTSGCLPYTRPTPSRPPTSGCLPYTPNYTPNITERPSSVPTSAPRISPSLANSAPINILIQLTQLSVHTRTWLGCEACVGRPAQNLGAACKQSRCIKKKI